MSRPYPITSGLSWDQWQLQFDRQRARAACMYYDASPSSPMLAPPLGTMPYLMATSYDSGMDCQSAGYMEPIAMPYHQYHQDNSHIYVKRECPPQNVDDEHARFRPPKTIFPNESARDTEKAQFDTRIDNSLSKIDSLTASLLGAQSATSRRSSVSSSLATSLSWPPTFTTSATGACVEDTFSVSATQPAKVKNHFCKICSKSFRRGDHLKTHLNRHNDVKPHGCPKCERRFVEKGELRKHDNAVHLKLRPFVCQMPSVKEGDICPRSFATHGNLKRHLIRLHPEHTHLQNSCINSVENRNTPQKTPRLLQWFPVTFQNSNNGGKGRGKGPRALSSVHGAAWVGSIARGSQPSPVRSTVRIR